MGAGCAGASVAVGACGIAVGLGAGVGAPSPPPARKAESTDRAAPGRPGTLAPDAAGAMGGAAKAVADERADGAA